MKMMHMSIYSSNNCLHLIKENNLKTRKDKKRYRVKKDKETNKFMINIKEKNKKYEEKKN